MNSILYRVWQMILCGEGSMRSSDGCWRNATDLVVALYDNAANGNYSSTYTHSRRIDLFLVVDQLDLYFWNDSDDDICHSCSSGVPATIDVAFSCRVSCGKSMTHFLVFQQTPMSWFVRAWSSPKKWRSRVETSSLRAGSMDVVMTSLLVRAMETPWADRLFAPRGDGPTKRQ